MTQTTASALSPDQLALIPERRCTKCRRIPWGYDDWERLAGNNSYVEIQHHDSFADLEQSAADGCALCCSFWAHTFYRHPSKDEVISGRCKLELSLNSVDAKFHVDDYFSPIYLQFLDKIEHPPKTLPAPKSFSPATTYQDLSSLVQERIHPWITDCVAGLGPHKDCILRDGKEGQTFQLPTRLIDVGSDLSPDPVRLVVSETLSKSHSPDYLILSYCWGRSNKPAKTTRANIADRQGGIDLETLPRTVADAIKLTRLMGFRYLWVDAVCIIQAWSGDAFLDDWKLEAPRMGSYYSNAKCLISAMAASDSDQGLFMERQVARFPTSSCLIGCDGTRGEYIHVPVPEPFPPEEMACQPLLRRGWCLQEWLLSPRILQWSSNGLFWQCTSVPYASEPSPEGYSMEKLVEETALAPRYAPAIFKGSKDEAIGTMWCRVMAEFQVMDLTYNTDRIAATEGLGQQVAAFHGDEYFATVFRSQLADGLTWVSPFYDESRAKVDYFPSWSFASCETKEEGDWLNIKHSLVRYTRPDVFPKSRSALDFSSLSSRMLRFQAPLLPVEFGQQNLPHYRTLRSEEWGLDLTLTFDANSLIPRPMGCISVLLLGSGDEFADLVGLIVVREGEVYKRLGAASIRVFTKGQDYMPKEWTNDIEAIERTYGKFRTELDLV